MMVPSGPEDRNGRKSSEGMASAADQDAVLPGGDALFDSLFRTMPQASAVWRLVRDKRKAPKDLVLVEANQTFCQLVGVSDPTGRHLRKWGPELLKGDPDILDIFSRVATTGTPETHKGYLAALDRWFEGRVSRIEVDLLFAQLEDVTERELEEKALKRARYSLDHVNDYLTCLDHEGRIVEVSDPTSLVLEYSHEELLQMTVFDIDPSLSQKEWHKRWNQTKKLGTRVVESQHRTKSGRVFPVEISTSSLVFEGDEYHCGFCRDISERKRMEEVLNDEVARRQLLVAQSSDGIVVLNQDGAVVEANEEYARQLGYSLEEVSRLHVWDWQVDYSKEELLDLIRNVDASGDHIDTRHRRKDGTFYDVEISSSGSVIGDQKYVFCVCRDVTTRRRLEQSLRLTQFSVDNAPDIIFWLASDGRVVFANRALCQLLGYTPDEIQSMRVWDIDPSLSEESWPQVWDRVGDSDGILHEEVLVGKDGREHSVEILSNHVEYAGKEYGVAVARDVTERKRTEQSLLLTQFTVDNAPDAIFWLTSDGDIVFANRACCELLGYTLDEMQTMYIWDIDPSLGPESWASEWDRVRTGGSFVHEEIFLGKDGRGRSVEISSNHVQYGGKEYGVTVARDISERRRTEQALRDSEEQLRQSQKMEAVGRLAGGIAHDFNNVLTTIIGYSDLILSSSDCPEGSLAEDVNEIKAAAERASGLTSRILAFSRRQALRPTVLSLNSIVSDTERLLARTIGADIELRVSLSPDLGQVEVDEQQFVQVLLNLAVNARDAMPKGGILTLETANVELDRRFSETHPDAHPGQYVMLGVTDTGTGMDEETLAHVFEPFYTTKPPGEGTGLGLSTVYGLIAQSGGCTDVHSRPGKGTTFSIYLPRVAERTASRKKRAESRSASQKRPAVLVVDSDAAFLTLTTRILERRGYEVHAARDGEQALTTLDDPSVSIDMLIADLVLSGSLQGDALARSTLAKRPELPVLFISEQDRDRMIRDGRVDEEVSYLEKPFTADELTAQVHKCVGEDHPSDDQRGDYQRPEVTA